MNCMYIIVLFHFSIKGTGQIHFESIVLPLLRMTKTEKLNKSFHLGQLIGFFNINYDHLSS